MILTIHQLNYWMQGNLLPHIDLLRVMRSGLKSARPVKEVHSASSQSYSRFELDAAGIQGGYAVLRSMLGPAGSSKEAYASTPCYACMALGSRAIAMLWPKCHGILPTSCYCNRSQASGISYVFHSDGNICVQRRPVRNSMVGACCNKAQAPRMRM